PAAGNVHAKTGTITYVRSLSGYVDTADGERVIFSTMCNNFTVPTSEVNKVQQAFTLLLANFSRNPKQPAK
ncbi:MAG: D-alanyl-D-alanine carboxypeptidase, partial [bacterium]